MTLFAPSRERRRSADRPRASRSRGCCDRRRRRNAGSAAGRHSSLVKVWPSSPRSDQRGCRAPGRGTSVAVACSLQEARIRTQALDAAAHFQRRRCPRRGYRRSSASMYSARASGYSERGVLVVRGVSERSPGGKRQRSRSACSDSDRGQVRVDLPAAAGDQFDAARVDVVGLFVGGLQARGVPAVEPGERGDAVLQRQRLAPLRVVDLRQRLVAARS